MRFRATRLEVFAALREAARRTGLLYVTGDPTAGRAVFTAGRYLMFLGEKVAVRIDEVEPGIIQVTFAPDSRFGVGGWSGRTGSRASRLADALAGLLPRVG
jgi:hypothetical protein